MNKKSYLLLSMFAVALIGCGSGGGISTYDWHGREYPPAPGPQWNAVAPLGVPVVYVGMIPEFNFNNVKTTYDTVNGILYAQRVNIDLTPIIFNKTTSPYWLESNNFQQQLATNSINVTSYLDADNLGNLYGFGLNSNKQVVLFTFNDNTQRLATYPLSGYPTNTQFGNLYYDNSAVYALASTTIGSKYSYSLVQFNANDGSYQKTIDLNYLSPNQFVNVFSLPVDYRADFIRSAYISGALGENTFFINESGTVTAISISNPLEHRQVGAKFVDGGWMLSGSGRDPSLAMLSPITYSHGKLFTCGLTIEDNKYSAVSAILGIASSANLNQPWESIGYTGFEKWNKTVVSYYGCMNISAYGNKIFANNSTNHDAVYSYPYTAMVYESSF